MPNSCLWELSAEAIALEEEIAAVLEDENLDEAAKEAKSQELFCQWLAKGEEFEEKSLQVAAWIRQQEAIAEARKAESRRLRELAQQAEKQATRMREYLAREMVRLGKRQIEGVTGKLSLRKKQPPVCLKIEPEKLPSQFVRVTYEPRLSEIRKALKEKPDLDWASFGEGDDYSLTIK
jgi:uncharacterized protein with HEPN domain